MIPVILGGLALGTAFGTWLESRRRKQTDSGWLPGAGMWPREQKFIIRQPPVGCARAMDWWESRVPGMFSELVGSGVETWSVCSLPGRQGDRPVTQLTSISGRVTWAVVSMPEEHTDDHRAWCHELGHVLGLGHDERYDSVMHPVAHAGVFVLTDHDRELLRTYYGDRSKK